MTLASFCGCIDRFVSLTESKSLKTGSLVHDLNIPDATDVIVGVSETEGDVGRDVAVTDGDKDAEVGDTVVKGELADGLGTTDTVVDTDRLETVVTLGNIDVIGETCILGETLILCVTEGLGETLGVGDID